MKGLKFASLAMASLMALSLVGCGPMEDPKVRFLRECKQSLSADECQQLAYNKSQEEQARIMKSGTYNSYANQPGGYSTPGYAPSPPQYQQGYAQPQYAQPQYGQPGYVQQNNSGADMAVGAVVGLAAGAAIGHAVGSSNNNRNVTVDNTYTNNQRQLDQQRADRERQYQQQVKDANAYRPNPVPAYTDTNKVTRFAAPSAPTAAPAPAPQQTQVRAQSVFAKPAASAPSAPAKSSYTARPSVFSKK